MEEKNIISKSSAFVKNSASLKIGVIILLTLLLLIPVSMVKSLIYERGQRQNEVVREISGKWGDAQTVAGPVLTIPYMSYTQQPNKTPVSVTRYVHFLPDTLNIKGTVEPEIRYRGIYEALLYTSDLEITGEFSFPDATRLRLSIEPENIMWEKAFFSMGISDMGGIRSQISGKIADAEIVLEPGIETADLFKEGVSGGFPLNIEKGTLPFSFHIGINGNSDLFFLPLGKETKVALSSNWPAPSFSGQFLPDQRQVDQAGFSAGWNVLHLNRNYPQSWAGGIADLNSSAFGVSLHPGTEIYQKTTRTAKYGVMFVVFTFTAFFLSEVINRIRIHPIQYLLVGCSVITFYVLLLAFSEHLGFNISFLLSVLAVILLISGYTHSILNKRMAVAVLGILIILYGYLFITLQLEDYALLVGSLGLFSTLAVVMYLTRKVNWYSLQAVTE